MSTPLPAAAPTATPKRKRRRSRHEVRLLDHIAALRTDMALDDEPEYPAISARQRELYQYRLAWLRLRYQQGPQT